MANVTNNTINRRIVNLHNLQTYSYIQQTYRAIVQLLYLINGNKESIVSVLCSLHAQNFSIIINVIHLISLWIVDYLLKTLLRQIPSFVYIRIIDNTSFFTILQVIPMLQQLPIYYWVLQNISPFGLERKTILKINRILLFFLMRFV